MRLTSKLGIFEFDDDESLSLCKLVRDTIVGQWLNPKPGNVHIHTPEEAQEFIRNHDSNLVKAVGFDLILHGVEDLELPVELEELPQPPMIPVPPIWIRQALVGAMRPSWLET